MNIEEVSIMTPTEAIYMYEWKEGFGRALGIIFGLYSG